MKKRALFKTVRVVIGLLVALAATLLTLLYLPALYLIVNDVSSVRGKEGLA